MSGFEHNRTAGTPSLRNAHPLRRTSREKILAKGLTDLQAIRPEPICKVCIANNGSCCIGCRHLEDGVGCQMRNLSCTAWLCGFLKFLLFKAERLQAWNDHWNQVPGLDYRVDFTPSYVSIRQDLQIPDLSMLSEALGADLEELTAMHGNGFILTLREELDDLMDQWLTYTEVAQQEADLSNRISFLASYFVRFNQAIKAYPTMAVH